ncbi:MAG: hypothetical protein ACK5EZ_07215 [Bacteroidota bacterium]|jgi:hypothetical protein
MEVHHPHGHHGPKNWKEYITEFLMLFAAVSLGFLAENIREGFIERHRSHELAIALKADVEQDIEKIKTLVNNREEVLVAAKRAVNDVEQNGFKRSDIKQYRNLLRSAFNWYYFEPTTVNLNQIINSGSLRYFKSKELIKAVSNYCNSINVIESRNEREKKYFYDVMLPMVVNNLNLAPMDTSHFTGDITPLDFFNKIDSGQINIKTKDLVLFDDSAETRFKVLNAFRSFGLNLKNTIRISGKPFLLEAQNLVKLLNKELED